MTWREVPLEASQHCNSESDSDDDSVAIDRSETDSDRRFCVRWFKTDSDRSESEKKQKIDLDGVFDFGANRRPAVAGRPSICHGGSG